MNGRWMPEWVTGVRAGAVLLLALLGVGGCQSPAGHRGEADRAAYDIIKATQEKALGRSEAFDLNTAENRLRRRLLQEQGLAMSGPASLGVRDLEPIAQWPDAGYLEKSVHDPSASAADASRTVRLSLIDALGVGARNSRDYQSQKERVFDTALRLDLDRDSFRATFIGALGSIFSANLSSGDTVGGMTHTGDLGVSQRFHDGLRLTAAIGIDLVKLLTADRSSSMGLTADGSVSIPLLRGSSKFIVTEPLTQAERNVVYATYDFERFKRTFAVRLASEYLGVLQQLDQVRNAEENYRRLIIATRRVRRLAEAGRQSEIQVDQAVQSELRARDRWIAAQQSYQRRLDGFKVLLGLPPDARVELERDELEQLAARAQQVVPSRLPTPTPREPAAPPDPAAAPASPAAAASAPGLEADAPVDLQPPDRNGAGPYELDEHVAVAMAFDHRLDLRVSLGRVDDAQRGVAVAADALQADLTLLGQASIGESRSIGSAGADDAQLRFERGNYSVRANLDLPFERTSERNRYRSSLIGLEQAVRAVQALEDQIKQDIRNGLRRLLESREGLRNQALAVAVAQKRVDSANLFLQAGRAQVRDLLEAEDSLVQAQNAFTSALVSYRVAELEIQRDMDVLEVGTDGLWTEYQPKEAGDERSSN